ncbi:hypothetical protein LTR20_007846 [Exophiala xenobiotica]|nr:hypothetical protein LTR20_007846 [Exophiala xenobiotica]KAK5509519.1 hypothetical protein LTR21_007709 [Exophiala xenobiotica]KAK5521988.1 hypothetical protein LTR07_004272 [Exophiala xenobiotica]
MPREQVDKLLHRFYEPLVLLYVLDPTQGDHVREEANRLPLDITSSKELRRRLVSALAYICDFEKGGDSFTAIFVTQGPLTYYIACNKGPRSKTLSFLRKILDHLEEVYDMDEKQRAKARGKILAECVKFSNKRLKAYWSFLRNVLVRCEETLKDGPGSKAFSALKQGLIESSPDLLTLCYHCYKLLRSPVLNFVRERASLANAQTNRRNPFAEVKHFVGRLAFHVKMVDVLIVAAVRLPSLFQDPQIEPVEGPLEQIKAPALRQKTRLGGIVNRMSWIARLAVLDRTFQVEDLVRRTYEAKTMEPRVHAELILLEYYYQHRADLELFENDRYIGTSKPACYCCSLYMHEHPAAFDQSASHQRIYLNWLPPATLANGPTSASLLTSHSQRMLNRMTELIRTRTIEQIRTQSARRPKNFDSTTGDTFSIHNVVPLQQVQEVPEPQARDYDSSDHDSTPEGDEDEFISDLATKLEASSDEKHADSEEDSDFTGGVELLSIL